MKGWNRYKVELVLFLFGLVIYGLFAGDRLKTQSSDPHFVYQADAWLNGQLEISPPPKKGDDWAKVSTVRTKDDVIHRGRFLQTQSFSYSDSSLRNSIEHPENRPKGRLRASRRFRTTTGLEFDSDNIKETIQSTHFMSFPPLPALLMLPQVLISGLDANDVWMTIFLAAFALAMFYRTLRRLTELGLSQCSPKWNIAFTLCLGFGTVFFYSAIQGRVWFTAHVAGVAMTTLYIYYSLGAKSPFSAGLFLGLATLARVPLAFAFPLFALEAWRMYGAKKEYKNLFLAYLRFALPVMTIAIIAMAYNQSRFDQPFEFGHSYLAVRQQANIESFGLFNLAYLKRNLHVAFTLLPSLTSTFPFVKMSGHGMALWITSPVLLCLLATFSRTRLFWTLLLSAAFIAIPVFFYQNTGWFQFGYRFSLDYTPYLILAIAIGCRASKRLLVLMTLGMAINCFGALTFNRHAQFYDASSYDSLKATTSRSQ